MPPFIGSWSPDIVSGALILLVGTGYYRCRSLARDDSDARLLHAWSFAVGLALWALATLSFIAVYSPASFWVRALQILLLLFAAPFFLAMGRPVGTLRAALGGAGRQRLDDVLAGRTARLVCSPMITSVLMLGTPWLLYLTPWYVASMVGTVIAPVTRILLLIIGFGYFYARLQSDPVPRRYPPVVSIGISVVETLGDGLLGLVLWLGPLIASDYYAGLHRTWGPSLRTDQSIGAGILWIVGDLLGLPFLMVLMRAFGTDEKAAAAASDQIEDAEPSSTSGALWWEADPQLRERFGPR